MTSFLMHEIKLQEMARFRNTYPQLTEQKIKLVIAENAKQKNKPIASPKTKYTYTFTGSDGEQVDWN